MRDFLRCVALMALLPSEPAGAANLSSERMVVDKVAEATALGEFCVNWAVDPPTVARFLRSRNVRVDGRYRAIFGAAYARTHEAAWRNGNYPAVCDRALDLYGPQGREIAGLVRPIWNGACGDCKDPAALVGY